MNCEYDNYFSWTSRIDDIITKIHDLNHGIKVNHSNYREIFNNLNQYLKIDDVILNTKTHPFLNQAVRGAIALPDHEFKIIFSDLLKKTDLKYHDLCDSENGCKLGKIRKEIFNGLAKFFEKADHDLDAALTESIPNYNHNLHFVNYEKVLEKSIEKFIELNSNEENSSELIDRFKHRIQEYKNLQHKTHDLSFKFDIAKILSIIDCEQSVLIHDFDQEEYYDINISEEYKNFPKSSLVKFDYKNGKPFVPFICAGGINYLPKALEKIYLVLFDHTIDNLNNYYANGLVYSEVGLEILFEYINSKNFQTNDEIKNFFESKNYQDLYDEYDEFYKKYISKKSSELEKDFYKSHFQSGPIEKMHLKEENSNESVHHFWFAPGSKNSELSGTWLKSLKKKESFSQKQNIFDQINNGLSFI